MSSLICRNISLPRGRTSLRLERAMWDALEEVARREGVKLSAICALVERRQRESSLTASVRVFTLQYFREAATEEGHRRAGHGHPAAAPEPSPAG